jgi:FeS assembly protein IscX
MPTAAFQGAIFMPKQLTWEDAEDIGILLSEAHPEIDPLTVRFTDLHKRVIELPDFKDDPKKSNEGKLEAIQMAWQTEFLDRTQG